MFSEVLHVAAIDVNGDYHAELEEDYELLYALLFLLGRKAMGVYLGVPAEVAVLILTALVSAKKGHEKTVSNRGKSQAHQKFLGHEFKPICLSFPQSIIVWLLHR